jgi:cobalt/nickel transport system permease protein
MHMADPLLSPAVGATFWGASLGAIAYSSKKLTERFDEKLIPLMGVFGAFIFSAQMINFTIPGTGSSGHLGGGMMLAAILGPYPAFIVMASVLTVQCLFFADGGLLALGANIWNLGVYPCFIAYPLVFKPLIRGVTADNRNAKRLVVASLLSSIVALQLGAFSVVGQTVLSGRSELPFVSFIIAMLPIHLAIALVEGVATAGVLNYIANARPEILDFYNLPDSQRSVLVKPIAITVMIAALVVGGVLSWFASEKPDGLEWSIEKVYGKPELETSNLTASTLAKVQQKTALLPDYDFKPSTEPHANKSGVSKYSAVNAGVSLSGILGSLIALGVMMILGLGVKLVLKRKT